MACGSDSSRANPSFGLDLDLDLVFSFTFGGGGARGCGGLRQRRLSTSCCWRLSTAQNSIRPFRFHLGLGLRVWLACCKFRVCVFKLWFMVYGFANASGDDAVLVSLVGFVIVQQSGLFAWISHFGVGACFSHSQFKSERVDTTTEILWNETDPISSARQTPPATGSRLRPAADFNPFRVTNDTNCYLIITNPAK